MGNNHYSENAKKQTNDQRTWNYDGRTSQKRPLETCKASGQSQMDIQSVCSPKATVKWISPSCWPFSTLSVPGSPMFQDEQHQRCYCSSQARSLSSCNMFKQCIWTIAFKQPRSISGWKSRKKVVLTNRHATGDKLCPFVFACLIKAVWM